MKIFCTKYALTKGVEEEDAKDCGNDMVQVGGPYPIYLHGEGKEWHHTLEGAKLRAEEMRLNKIKSLKKSLDKFMNMTFD